MGNRLLTPVYDNGLTILPAFVPRAAVVYGVSAARRGFHLQSCTRPTTPCRWTPRGRPRPDLRSVSAAAYVRDPSAA